MPRSASTRAARLPRGEGARLATMILDAADELLDRTGDVSAVSMAKIAAAVQRTQPAVYAHFEDKDALIRAVCERTFERLGRLTGEAVAGIADAWERLDRRARIYVEFATRHPEHYRLLFSARRTGEPGTDDLQQLRGYAGLAGLRDDVAQAMRDGTLRAGDPDTVSLAMWSCVHGVASLLVAHPDASWPPDLLDQVLAMTAAGLLTPGSDAADRSPAGTG